MKGKKIFLVGMPGSGKSYFGRVLRDEMNLEFFDLDEVIEEKEKKKITEIFSEKGEEYFRQLERECLLEVIRSHEDFILATGGGTPCFFDNMEIMNKAGLTVFLQASEEVLLERVSGDEDRPLMRGNAKKTIAELLDKRLNFYQRATMILGEEKDLQSFLTQSAVFFKS